MPDREPRRLLILGGTGEAAALARGALAEFEGRLEVVTSLAGRTREPAPVPGTVRVGGFGGPDGLAAALADERIDLLIDATHPFAATISANARQACDTAGVPRLVLVRPPWRWAAGDRWIEVDDAAAAAAVVADHGERAFITLGARDLHHFARLFGVTLLVRLIESPERPPMIANCTVIVGRGPFTVGGEKRLLAEHRIDVVVSKASGGDATYAKIAAAREMGLPVILVRRPPPPEGEHADSVGDALAWIAGRLQGP